MNLSAVTELVPSPILDTAADSFVAAKRHQDQNEFVFTENGHEFRYTYTDKKEFSFFFNAIQNGETRREGVPLELFNFDGGHDAIIDIGAHFGLYTVIFGVQNPDAEFVAFEPSSSNAAICEQQVAANGMDATVEQAAVSDHDGEAELALAETEQSGLNWFESSVSHSISPELETTKTETVPVRSIDSILDELDAEQPFVKIDAEGAEYQIMDELLERNGPIRGFVELHPDLINDGSAFEIILWLEENGFDHEIIKDRVPTRPGLFFEPSA